jgi:hypothetical protein
MLQMRITCIPVLLLLITGHAMAQEPDLPPEIVTDRPDRTESPVLTPKGWFQVEMGTQREYDHDKELEIRNENILYNTTLWKYGLSRNFELRLVTEGGEDKQWTRSVTDAYDSLDLKSGFKPIKVGSKIFLTKQKGLIPDISFLSHLSLAQTGSEDFAQAFTSPDFRFLFTHKLSDKFQFAYNLGASWEADDGAATGEYTASFEWKIIDKLAMFIEAYGFLKEEQLPDHRADGGFTFLITDHVQLDCSGGVGLQENSPDYFVSAGLSFRLNAFDKAHRKKD